MNTTLLFAELLIIGLQAAVWIFILLVNVFGTGWVQAIQASNLANWQAAILIVLLSVFYVIGVIIDRAADALFSGWEWKHKNAPCAVLREAPSKEGGAGVTQECSAGDGVASIWVIAAGYRWAASSRRRRERVCIRNRLKNRGSQQSQLVSKTPLAPSLRAAKRRSNLT